MANKSAQKSSQKSASKKACKKEKKCSVDKDKRKAGDRKTLSNGAIGEYYERKKKDGTIFLAFKIVKGPTMPMVRKAAKKTPKSPKAAKSPKA
jgi:hypothetical protein